MPLYVTTFKNCYKMGTFKIVPKISKFLYYHNNVNFGYWTTRYNWVNLR